MASEWTDRLRLRLAARCRSWLLIAGLLVAGMLDGCQSPREQMLAEGYPPAFIDGFEAGCSSGRQAAGALGHFRKEVPRYLEQPLYAEGWEDGFRQCQALADNAMQRERRDGDRRDREWRQHVERAMAKALRRR